MAATPADLLTSRPPDASEAPRVEFVKCSTAWCRTNLGVRKSRHEVYWHVPTHHNTKTGITQITCPCCQAVRTWNP